MDDNSGRIEELNRELDALRAMKNSYGYELLINRIKAGAYKTIDDLLDVNPQEVGKVGIYQGDILAARRLTGHLEDESLLESMIGDTEEELRKLTRDPSPTTSRAAFMRTGSARF